jgi:hypothetical protein
MYMYIPVKGLIPSFSEGLAVGVGFGAIGKTPSATLESARYIHVHVYVYFLLFSITLL